MYDIRTISPEISSKISSFFGGGSSSEEESTSAPPPTEDPSESTSNQTTSEDTEQGTYYNKGIRVGLATFSKFKFFSVMENQGLSSYVLSSLTV